MKACKTYSDETINEYLDGELDTRTEKEFVLASLDDQELGARVRELRQVRALVRQALAIEPGTGIDGSNTLSRNKSVVMGIAASVLVVIGVLIGWGLQPKESFGNLQAVIGPGSIKTTPQLVAGSYSENTRVILLISSADTGSMRTALDQAENLLQTYRDAGRALRLEILVNSGGLNLFRQDKTPFSRRLASMQREFSNLELLACSKTINRLRREKHIDAKLVSGVKIVPSALDQILSRLNDGWSYIKV
ncbi:MAG: hypothetical protein ACC641_02640 [Acidiferrobacterales bacterium]